MMHRDLKCSNLLLDVSGRVTWRNILLASLTHNDFFQPCGRSKIGPRVQPVEKNFEARQPR